MTSCIRASVCSTEQTGGGGSRKDFVMQNYVYYNPTKLYFGDRQLEKLGEVVRSYGSRVLLMYGQGSIKRNGIYEAVMNPLKAAGLQVF